MKPKVTLPLRNSSHLEKLDSLVSVPVQTIRGEVGSSVTNHIDEHIQERGEEARKTRGDEKGKKGEETSREQKENKERKWRKKQEDVRTQEKK